MKEIDKSRKINVLRDFFYLSDGQSKDTKMPTSDKVPLLNRY